MCFHLCRSSSRTLPLEASCSRTKLVFVGNLIIISDLIYCSVACVSHADRTNSEMVPMGALGFPSAMLSPIVPTCYLKLTYRKPRYEYSAVPTVVAQHHRTAQLSKHHGDQNPYLPKSVDKVLPRWAFSTSQERLSLYSSSLIPPHSYQNSLHDYCN